MRTDARHNEAAAWYNAKCEEREQWQGIVEKIVAEKDPLL
jgi:hypothetical protein